MLIKKDAFEIKVNLIGGEVMTTFGDQGNYVNCYSAGKRDRGKKKKKKKGGGQGGAEGPDAGSFYGGGGRRPPTTRANTGAPEKKVFNES